MMFFHRFPVRGIEDAPDLVFFLAEQDIMMRHAEFIRRRALGLAKLLRRHRVHFMGVDVFWHGG